MLKQFNSLFSHRYIGDFFMPKLLIKCPACKAIVDTGITVSDLNAFCSSKLEENLKCHSCQSELAWNKDDVLAISFC